MEEIQLTEYEDLRPKEDNTYDEIVIVKEKIEKSHLAKCSWKQWLILAISILSAIVASTVTYCTVRAQVKQQLGLLDIKLLDIEMKLRESENEDNLKISRIQKQLNDTTAIAQVQKQLGILDIKMSDIEMQLNESKHECSLKISLLQTQITDSTAQVGFTVLGHVYGTRSPGYQLKFPFIRSSIGISNLSSMTNNGTFVCEKKGLYLVTVTVMACSRGRAAFTIYKNHWEFMKCYIGRGDYYREDCHSGVGTAVVVLGVNDVVYVRVRDTSITLYENWSSFSAVKLK